MKATLPLPRAAQPDSIHGDQATHGRPASIAELENAARHPDLTPGSRSTARRRADWPGILAITFALGLLAVWMNGILYRTQQPVYDSVSYLERLHRVMSITRDESLSEGLREATIHTTVCLPWLAGVILAPIFEPSRALAVVLQCGWIVAFLWSLNRLLLVAGMGERWPGRLALGLVGTTAFVFFTNGGLSDFRMDLSLALGYAATLSAVLVALRRGTTGNWFAVGLLAAATCLCRATAPVYLALAAGPLLVWHLVRRNPDRRKLISGAFLASGTAIVMAGWFYLLNADYLRYYYGEWNTDANARLEFWQALRHVEMLWRQTGWAATSLAVALALLRVMWPGRSPLAGSRSDVAEPPALHRGLIIAAAWIALAPVLLLVGIRAGLNPFVSMPSAAGLVMLAAVWLAGWTRGLERWQLRVVGLLVLLAATGAAARGWKKHRFPNDRFMAAHRQAIDAVLEDARRNGIRHLRLASTGTVDATTDSLFGSVLYDRDDVRIHGRTVMAGEVRIEPDRLFDLPARANWKEVPGANEGEQIGWLVSEAVRRVDYVVLPDGPTAEELAERFGHDEINRRLPELRKRLMQLNPEPLRELRSENSRHVYLVYRLGPGRPADPARLD